MSTTKTKKRKRKQRRLFLALLMILFTGIVLTTSTYAWFTANKTVTVSNIDVNVAAANGLQISVDGINWKTIISNADITGVKTTYPGAVNQLPSTTESLSPVSTIGDIDAATGFMKMFSGEIASNAGGDQILSAVQTVEKHGTTGQFIAFDLFFQVNDVTPLYLTSNSNVIAKNTSTGIENAARVGFTIQGNTATGSPDATIQGLKATDGTGKVFVWEPNYDVHTAAAVANASSNYGQSTTTTGAERLPYYGVKADITADADIRLNSTDATYFSLVNPQITSVAAGIPSANYASAFTLQKGITKVRLYMWIEGQDVDCENNASGGSISYNLQFSSNANAG